MNQMNNSKLSQDDTLFIVYAVFEYVQCANDKYIECHRRMGGETEGSLHYKDIIDTGNNILVELSKSDIEIEYNISEYIKGLQS